MEGLLRVFSYGHNVDLIVSHPSDQYEEYYMLNPYVGVKYFNKFEPTSSTNDIFLKSKPENGFRIFIMGSSTTFGFPYDRNLMASRILHKRLSDSYPDKLVEVINTSITAINSVTLKDYIGQILDYEPDAIILYAGHNEFYGAFGVASNERMSENSLLQNLHFKFINLRIYQLLRSTISWLSAQLASESASASSKGTLMKRIVQDENITYKGEKYIKGIEQYRSNLSYIINECKGENVPLLISDLVSNIRDLPPFGDSEKEKLSAKLK
ncbi:MAG: SGNH/GDSL hydrolase family protein, partial [Melioribacteraceae bacterium]|nr:SGNH/GDSL hydrolase family protein [Melioribacteraceae bacterium]